MTFSASGRSSRRISGRGLAKPVDRSTASYQAGAQTPSVGRRPGAQDSIAESKATPQASHSASRTPRGSAEHVLTLDDRRRLSQSIGRAIEKLGLRRQTDLLEGEVVALLRVGREHRLGRADEKGVGDTVAPLAPEFGQHVVRHMLLVPDRLAARRRAHEPVRDFTPVGRLRGDHLVPHRMNEARRSEIGRIEGLVDHLAIGARAEGAHHRRRNVPWTRPHRDADARLAAQELLPSASSASSAFAAARRRRVKGPDASLGSLAASPIARPSTRTTGTRPAKVPVVKASSAP